jgi:hypothetical protein
MKLLVGLGSALTVLLAGVLPAGAADPARTERAPAREPAYQSKAPQYCLLLFGPGARTRVWVVWDGDTVYVDRNGDGDLTEPGKRLVAPRFRPSIQDGILEEREVMLSAVADGKLRHENLLIRQQRPNPAFRPRIESERQLKALVDRDPHALIYEVTVEVEVRQLPGAKLDLSGRIRQWAGTDARGYLQFAGRPRHAPVVHFGGPLEMALYIRQTLPRGDKPGDLMAMIGTPGRGPGTFASVSYAGLFSEDAQPVADITFPARAPGRPPVTAQVRLPYRC